ncbi:MAG: GNAT family N-acetyltransferase [Candidatus Thorarchaeota archaeon]
MLSKIVPDEFTNFLEIFDDHKRARNLLFDWIQLRKGKMTVDSINNPTVALYTFSQMGFIAGDSSSENAIPLIKTILPLTIIIPPDSDWGNLIRKQWGKRTQTLRRTRMSHETLDIDFIRQLKNQLNNECKLEKINLAIIENSEKTFWSSILFFFKSYEDFLENSIGFCVLNNNITVSVAYTAFPFVNDFEIQVMTLDNPEFRRKGHATVACAALIENGLSNGMVPHWDAANPASVKLAEKLGYSNPDPYDVFYWM